MLHHIPYPVTWAEAQEECANLGMVLAAPDGIVVGEEDLFAISSSSEVWVGVSSFESSSEGPGEEFTSETGLPWDLTYSLAASATGGDTRCVAAHNTNGWQDTSCCQAKQAVCQKPPTIQGPTVCPQGWVLRHSTGTCLRSVRTDATFLQGVTACAAHGAAMWAPKATDDTTDVDFFVGAGDTWVGALREPDDGGSLTWRHLQTGEAVAMLGSTTGPTAVASVAGGVLTFSAQPMTSSARVVCERGIFGTSSVKECPEGWLPLLGACVRSSMWEGGAATMTTSDNARRLCVAQGGNDLIQVHSDEAGLVVGAMMSTSGSIPAHTWVGAERDGGSGRPRWSMFGQHEACDGTYSNTIEGQAGCPASFTITVGQRMGVRRDNGKLQPISASAERPYMCAVYPGASCQAGTGYKFYRGKCYGREYLGGARTWEVAEAACRVRVGGIIGSWPDFSDWWAMTYAESWTDNNAGSLWYGFGTYKSTNNAWIHTNGDPLDSTGVPWGDGGSDPYPGPMADRCSFKGFNSIGVQHASCTSSVAWRALCEYLPWTALSCDGDEHEWMGHCYHSNDGHNFEDSIDYCISRPSGGELISIRTWPEWLEVANEAQVQSPTRVHYTGLVSIGHAPFFGDEPTETDAFYWIDGSESASLQQP